MRRRFAILLALLPGAAAATPFSEALSACWGQAGTAEDVAAGLTGEGWAPAEDPALLADTLAMIAPFQTERAAADAARTALADYEDGLAAAEVRVAEGVALTDSRGTLLLVERSDFVLTCHFVFSETENAGLYTASLPPIGEVLRAGPMRMAQTVPQTYGAHGVLWRPDLDTYAAIRTDRPAGGAFLLTTSALQR